MKKLDKRSWLSTLGLSPEPSGRDLGDMGTAFGLDASLVPTLPMPLDLEPGTIEPPPAEQG